MQNKPDDRSDNVERIEYNLNSTMKNIHLADEMIEKTDDPNCKKELTAKNERREEAIEGMRREIRDEAMAKEKGYK